jgi:hypothetical protein
MKVSKQPIIPERIRRPPPEGWSWIDRRFFREFAGALPQEAVLLDLFLVSVSDRDGLSYYSDSTIAGYLHMPEVAVGRAREELEARDLIAYQPPIYQVLSVPRRQPRAVASEPASIREIMRRLMAQRGDLLAPLPDEGGFKP